ncbi:unnamed protein product [Rangifer tarandus platyrhynchus]|uniref:Uncharacterized protein n=1 Tax=Rangifer tarandus platyrhynchus TaxID=3082113 RepID=A0ABN8YL11_RANTA|nr:unnamed protein product [Rangifer tarandus platyrhynchus]
MRSVLLPPSIPQQPSESNSERTAPILQMGLWNPEKAWLVASHVSERRSIWLQSLSPQGPGCPLTATDADPEMRGEELAAILSAFWGLSLAQSFSRAPAEDPATAPRLHLADLLADTGVAAVRHATWEAEAQGSQDPLLQGTHHLSNHPAMCPVICRLQTPPRFPATIAPLCPGSEMFSTVENCPHMYQASWASELLQCHLLPPLLQLAGLACSSATSPLPGSLALFLRVGPEISHSGFCLDGWYPFHLLEREAPHQPWGLPPAPAPGGSSDESACLSPGLVQNVPYFPASGASTLALDTSHSTPWSSQGPLHACPLGHHSDAITSPTPPVPSLTHLGTPPAALSSRQPDLQPALWLLAWGGSRAPWRKAGLDLPSAGERLALQTPDPEGRGPASQSISEKTGQCQSAVLPGDGGCRAATAADSGTAGGSGEHGCTSLAGQPHPSQSAVLSPLNGFQSQGSGGPHAGPCPSPLISRLEVPFPGHAVPLCPPPGANRKCPMESVMSPLPPGTHRTSSPTPSSQLTPLTLSRPSLRLLRGQEQKAPRSERPVGMRLATSQEAMPGSSWGVPGSTLCTVPGTYKTEPRHSPGTHPGTRGVSESGNTAVSKTCSFSKVLGRRHQGTLAAQPE